MKPSTRNAVVNGAVLLVGARVFVVLTIYAWLYTTGQLALAKARGVYPTPEEGMLALCQENNYYGPIERIEIDYAGIDNHDGTQPHVWYVIATVWPKERTHGRDWHNPGSYFLRVRDGWVHVPEGSFPHLIGSFMEVFGLA